MIQGQRWATVPDHQFPVRSRLLRWKGADAAQVRAFVERQAPFGPVLDWVATRRALYAKAFPEATAGECEREAMLDLICWQRQEPNASAMLAWLREWELAVASGINSEDAKGAKKTP